MREYESICPGLLELGVGGGGSIFLNGSGIGCYLLVIYEA